MLMRLRPAPSSSRRKQNSGGPAVGHLYTRFRGGDGRRRGLGFAVLVSVGLHIMLLAALLLWSHRTPRSVDAFEQPGAIELVLQEQKGTGPTTVPSEPAPPAEVPLPPQQSRPPTPPTAAAETAEALPLPPPPVPPPMAATSESRETGPPMQVPRQAPQINLGGNDSETNAIVFGPNVIPASLDSKFRNREPVYPPDAVRHAEAGAVTLLIHISPDGLPTGVDVTQSSGFLLLDREARDKALSWHFLPAVQDGQPIPSSMAMRVVFQLK